ncbi:MAG: LacI family DNA-binding transcriptional regulator [Parvibaculaceae bacterium]
MTIRIYDVAKLAGVSIATASHALNGKGRVSKVTQERIRRIAKKLGYKANPYAASLKTGRTNLLAVQIGWPGPKETLVPGPAYVIDILTGISTEAFDRGWTPVVVPRGASISDLDRLSPDCGIVVDPLGNETLLEALSARAAPLITTGRLTKRSKFRPSTSYVDNDAIAVTHAVLDHLLDAGYRKPSIVVSYSSASYVADTIRAGKLWGAQHGVQVPVVKVKRVISTIAEAAIKSQLLSDEPPDAIYATDESGALGAVRAARALGLEIPRDLGVICGFDGPLLQEAFPPISAVDILPVTIGRRAVAELAELVTTRQVKDTTEPVPFSIRVRQSTARSEQA